jgi:ABC-type antimicrobial peptide transport system permease subunit
MWGHGVHRAQDLASDAGASRRSAAEARAEDERLLARVAEGKRRAGVHLSLLPSVILTARCVHVNALRDKRRTLIGVATVFVVVTFVAVLYNAVLRSPLIFLRLAESLVGELDMLITPYVPHFDPLLDLDSQSEVVPKFEFFNATALDLELASLPAVAGSAPRWLLKGRAASHLDPRTAIDTAILICDLERERELNIGRGWPHRLLNQGEAHVMSSLLYSLKMPANEGRRLRVDIGVPKLLSTFGLDVDFLESLILSSIRADNGIYIQLDGAEIARQLSKRGISVPADVLPDVLQTRVPVSAVLDFHKLVSLGIQGAARGELMALDVTVIDAVTSTYDKWPNIGNVVLMEKRYFLQAVKEAANRVPIMQLLNIAALVNRTDGDYEAALLLSETPVSDAWFDRDMNDYAFALVVHCRQRLSSYTKDTKTLVREMAEFSNQVGERLGFGRALTLTLPIFEALKPLKYLRAFLNQVFSSVTFILIAHGSIVVYSLMLSDATARTYEYGMLRVLGLTHRSLALAMVMQALYYAIPGVVLGLLASLALSAPIIRTLDSYAKVDASAVMLPTAARLATALGLVMPLVATIGPMRRVLSRSLAESLDLYHQTSTETSVHVERLESLGLSASQTVVAVALVLAGSIVFYLIPMAFLFQDFDLLFSVLNIILMATVIGLILLSVLIQPALEHALARCLIWGSDARFLDVVQKNLSAHYERSRKTALIFCSSLAFIIFAGTMFALQADSIVGNVKVMYGSDLRIDSSTGALNEEALAALMQREMARNASERVVVDYAFASWPLWNVDPPVATVRLNNLVNFPTRYSAEVVSVSGNFLDVAYGEYAAASATDGCSVAECVRGLDVPYSEALKSRGSRSLDILSGYSRPSWCEYSPGFCDIVDSMAPTTSSDVYFDALVPASLQPSIGAEVGTPLVMSLVCQNQRAPTASRVTRYLYLQIQPKALIRKMPGFFFSSYEAVAIVQNPVIIMGPSAYQRIFDMCVAEAGINASAMSLPTRPPKRTMHVKLVPSVTEKQRIRLQNRLASLLDENGQMTDTIMYTQLTAATVEMLMIFFYVLSGIASVLCFFMLHINFEANVRDNLWEFGVLRALGISKHQTARIFIYESLSVILGAIITGSVIGLLVACILTLQQNVFTEMPFRLIFPGWLWTLLTVLSILVAALGAYIPVRDILPWSIARVLKQA